MSMTNSKKKILYVITKSNWGGAQRYVFDLATNLPKDEFEVVVALGGTGSRDALHGLLSEKLLLRGIRVIKVRGFVRDVSPLWDFGTLLELAAIFREERPDIVHLNSTKAIGLGSLAARISGVPRIISTVHGWASHEARPTWQRTLIQIFEYISRLLSHETIVVCEADAIPGKTVTIRNGIVPPHLLSRNEARAELGLPISALVVGSIGELTPNKNFELLVKATKQASAELKTEVVLAIIGDGEEREKLIAAAKASNFSGVRLPGYRPEAAQYISAFDIFVLPSRKEGLPYVLIEAGYAQRACIATSVGGNAEIIENGISGTIIPPHNLGALARAIARLIESDELRIAYGNTLHAQVEEKFSLSRMIAETTLRYKI